MIALRCNVSIFQQPRQPSMNDEMEPRYIRKAPDNKASQRPEVRASKSRRPDNGGLKSDSSSATRVDNSRSRRTKAADLLPPIDKPISHNDSSSVPFNPRRNPPTVRSVENDIRPNRGSARPQGSVDSRAQLSNNGPSTPSRKPRSTGKKVV